MIEDTGPIHHLEEEEGEEGEGFDDKDLDDLMYDGDPLAVASDYEDDDDINGKRHLLLLKVYNLFTCACVSYSLAFKYHFL